ncbi:hypothetical protein D9M71_772840 [compost metagenome]
MNFCDRCDIHNMRRTHRDSVGNLPGIHALHCSAGGKLLRRISKYVFCVTLLQNRRIARNPLPHRRSRARSPSFVRDRTDFVTK